ncbi:hypothetical protein [Parabacteroides bouchesdurhonensis]|uniref:hypothetical protein n=1 Tax=Parabacteroides bouchesdurhonensis TaxID=1936995 RepID=UPI000E4DEF87|nr:hypothetical protein [Parabacteroides bouchesdurhonensis]RHJ90144.1 hypothetical protein DW095_14005 [Bacteroides sp. AM07-16]
MDNLNDWLYIVFLIIAGVSGLLGSGKKKKQSKQILGQPGNSTPSNNKPATDKGFWDILQEVQEEKPKQPRVVIKQKEQKKEKTYTQQTRVSTPTSSSPFLSGEKVSTSVTKNPISERILAEEEESGFMPETFNEMAELRKAIIYTEILNRKY